MNKKFEIASALEDLGAALILLASELVAVEEGNFGKILLELNRQQQLKLTIYIHGAGEGELHEKSAC